MGGKQVLYTQKLKRGWKQKEREDPHTPGKSGGRSIVVSGKNQSQALIDHASDPCKHAGEKAKVPLAAALLVHVVS